MVKIKKYANGIERFLHGEKGQRFFNFAYSIGAAIVIWGALFKILHLPGGSTLLCIGMGTEIAMFILTAFDRPPRDYAWEDVFPVLDSHNPEERPGFSGGQGITVVGDINAGSGYSQQEYSDNRSVESMQPGGSVAPAVSGGVISLSEEDADSLRESITKMSAASEQLSHMAELTTATQQYFQQMSSISEQMQKLSETTRSLNEVSEVLLNSYRAITDNGERISENSKGYVDKMEDLNRNISGLNTIYEIQLKGVSSQLETIDRVNRGLKDIRDMYEKSARESSHYCEETEKMARYMKQLNRVYEKMITAMTINMSNPMMGGNSAGYNPFGNDEDKA